MSQGLGGDEHSEIAAIRPYWRLPSLKVQASDHQMPRVTLKVCL